MSKSHGLTRKLYMTGGPHTGVIVMTRAIATVPGFWSILRPGFQRGGGGGGQWSGVGWGEEWGDAISARGAVAARGQFAI